MTVLANPAWSVSIRFEKTLSPWGSVTSTDTDSVEAGRSDPS